MKSKLLPALLSLAMIPFAGAQETATPPATPPADAAAQGEPKPLDATALDKVSYFIGLQVAKSLEGDGIEVNLDTLTQALKDSKAGAKHKYEEADLISAMEQLQAYMQFKQQKMITELSAKNSGEGKKFLETNGKREGVTTTASGLQYEVLKKGDGAKPTASDTVKVHYHGTLLDGKVFDSSVDRGDPVSFPLGNVIPGWIEGLQLMPVGSKYKLFIPSELAYGEQGNRGIAPNSTLVFEVELLGIEKPAADPAAPKAGN